MDSQNTNVGYTEPEFSLPEKQKNKDWYMQYARYWSTFYNADFRDNVLDSEDYYDNLRPIEKARKYALYYSGRQENINYNHMTQDISGNALHSVWIKGKKIHGLLNHIMGSYTTMLVGKEINVLNLSPDVQNKKSRLYNKAMFRYDKQGMEVFKDLENMGVQFTPIPGQSFDGPESVERYMEYDWKETGQITGTDIAKDLEERNMSNNMYLQSLLNYAAANYAAVYNYALDGKIYQENIPFWNLLYVPGLKEDPFNRDMLAVGFYEQLSPREVLSKWGDELSKDTIEKLKKFKSDGDFDGMEAHNNDAATMFFDVTNRTVNVLHVFWIGEHDLRYEQTVNEDGEISYKKNKKKFEDERSDYIIDDIQQCTLIGGLDAVEYGYSNNVVRNDLGPELPIKVLSGRTLYNSGVSIIGKLSQNQDKIDALRYKIMDLVGKAAGKVHIVNGDVVDGSTADLVSDLKTMGLSVRKPSGNSGDPTDSKRMVDTIDWSIDPNILLLRDLYMEEERIMEEAVSISKIALGTQDSVVGKAVQQNSIARSTLGLTTIYEDFIKFNEINLQYGLNLSKIVLTVDGDYEGIFMTGDRGIKWMKVTKEFSYSDLLLYIKVKDTIDEGAKNRLNQYAFAYMQNPEAGDTILDVLKLEQATSWTAAINELEFSIKNRNKKNAMMAQQQAQQEQAAADKEREFESGKIKFEEDQATARAGIEAEAGIEKEAMKSDTKLEAEGLRQSQRQAQ